MKPVSFEVEIDAKPNTQEFSDKMFSAMAKIMNDITKDLYPDDERYVEYLVKRTNGNGYKVIRIEHLSPRYFTIDNLRYFKIREQAEKYRDAIISNSSELSAPRHASQESLIAVNGKSKISPNPLTRTSFNGI